MIGFVPSRSTVLSFSIMATTTTERNVCTSQDNAVLNAIFNPHTPYVEDLIAQTELNGGLNDQVVPEKIKTLEVDAVNLAQKGDLVGSLNLLNKVISEAPNYASGYNNRAQAFRIQGDNESALNDLNKAISLSNGTGLAASQAYVQRGLLYQLKEDEEKAKADFQVAANLGNAFAKSQLVAMNPYAALCNQMLGEVFSRISRGEQDMT